MQAICHITHILSTLACSLIQSVIDYPNTVLHAAPIGTIQKLQRVQNVAARIVLQASRPSHAKPLLHQMRWLTVLTPLRFTLAERICNRTLRSSAIPLLVQPFTRTDFSQPAFRYSAPSVWNWLPSATASVLDQLKWLLLNTDLTCRSYGTIEVRLVFLL